MPAPDGSGEPTRSRTVIATLIVLLTIIAAWMIIELRTQPPPVHALPLP